MIFIETIRQWKKTHPKLNFWAYSHTPRKYLRFKPNVVFTIQNETTTRNDLFSTLNRLQLNWFLYNDSDLSTTVLLTNHQDATLLKLSLP